MKLINKLPKDYLILLSIIIVFCIFTLIMTSCGAKTVNKEETKTDSIAKNVTVLTTDSTSIDKKVFAYDVETDEIVIEAVDTTEPIEITNNEGKVTRYKNARLSKKKRKDNTIVVSEKIVAKIVVDSVSNEIEVNKVESTKIVYKEQFNWGTFILHLWWLWLLIILAMYLAYRRYKGYIKFPLL
jgi:predicted metalloprotease